MKLSLLAVGNKMPTWVNTAFNEYAGRLPPECALSLKEIPLGRRSKQSADTTRAVREEGKRMLAAIPETCRVIALEVTGTAWHTEALARQLASWMADGRNVSLLVGGPDGLDERCRQRAEQFWSLSPLTLPHGLVRVIVAEQLYRAWSILQGHPYHRG